MVTKKNLVTTAIESTWPSKGSILFLGSWCCSFSRREYISSLEYEIAPYHWDDREKLANDYKNLVLIYEFYLIELTKKLNEIHNKEYSPRYWRILIGPWLYTCIQVIFDRWFMLKQITNNDKKFNMLCLDKNFSSLVCDDLDAFNIAIEKDVWNEQLYAFLANKFFSSDIKISFQKKYKTNEKIFLTKKNHVKSFVKWVCNTLSSLVSRNKDIFIIAPHMSISSQILLNLKLSQFPVFWFRESKKEISAQKPFLRRIVLNASSGIDKEFEDVLNNLLFKLIPKCYLEGFSNLEKLSNSQKWPESPKSIFTSNAYSTDEVFKCWAGKRVDEGSKLIIGQHGGNFGMTPMAIHEDHQIKISDKWLSWGWGDKNESKIIPVGNFKSKRKKINNAPEGDALLVSMTLPKYSYYLYSVPIAGQISKYFDDQLSFANALPCHIQKKLRIRIYPHDREWNQIKRWQSKFPNMKFDIGKKTLITSLKKSRIFIGTYNATTYLETFTANMPTILFWNPNHWEIKDESVEYFQKLVNVNILHHSPHSAAKHLENIWNHIDDWWGSDHVQKAVKDFNKQYSNNNIDIISSIAKQLK